MSHYSEDIRNDLLDFLTPDTIKLHDGPPGTDGTGNQIGTGQSASFDSASAGQRTLSSSVVFSSLGANHDVLYVSVWDGSTFICYSETFGAVTADGSGNYTVSQCTLSLGVCS